MFAFNIQLSGHDVDNDLTRLIEKGSITFGFSNTGLPPFYGENDSTGEFEGLDVDLAYHIASLLGVKPVFDRSAVTYDELYENLQKGEIDLIIAKFSRTLDRSINILYQRSIRGSTTWDVC